MNLYKIKITKFYFHIRNIVSIWLCVRTLLLLIAYGFYTLLLDNWSCLNLNTCRERQEKCLLVILILPYMWLILWRTLRTRFASKLVGTVVWFLYNSCYFSLLLCFCHSTLCKSFLLFFSFAVFLPQYGTTVPVCVCSCSFFFYVSTYSISIFLGSTYFSSFLDMVSFEV